MQANFCECCGAETDGLFPILAEKIHDPSVTDCLVRYSWCGECWDYPSCKGPCCGVCYAEVG